MRTRLNPAQLLRKYRIGRRPLFVLGSFDENVTVLSQQVRALNLAFSLIETHEVPVRDEKSKRVAIVGAGFAGLTLAAALLRKQAAVEITLLEERNTLLPLQQGSDTRWLHPNIYDWPADLSEEPAAMLPVLSWSAARASDVVVQVLKEWSTIVRDAETSVLLYCNTRHLHIDRRSDDSSVIQIEWIGERRHSGTGQAGKNEPASGQTHEFDLVVMAVGFGLEKEQKFSYWRNETLGQPSLTQSRVTYLVSGQGDGAMIDLLRLRISQYRQDRILEELFHDKNNLVEALRSLKRSTRSGGSTVSLFSRFDKLRTGRATKDEWVKLIQEVYPRLRRDTDVVLRLKPEIKNLSTLFQLGKRRISFQNALLVFILYECGGFAPSSEEEVLLCDRLGIRAEQVVRRHGPNRREQFKRSLAKQLDKLVREKALRQPAEVHWPGGYFGMAVRAADKEKVKSAEREGWRKEYLPGPTSFLASTITGAIAGVLEHWRSKATHFRVTLHRVIELNNDTLLQQVCEYSGRSKPPTRLTAGRTFPADMATIGQAYACRNPIRSYKKTTPANLQKAMNILSLKEGARDNPTARFVLAIPVLQPESGYVGPSPVSAVLYIDSQSPNFWLNDNEVNEICRIIEKAVEPVSRYHFDRVRNFCLPDVRSKARNPRPLHSHPIVRSALEILRNAKPPVTPGPFQFNFHFSDFNPVVNSLSTTA